jgi:hypothetical protein
MQTYTATDSKGQTFSINRSKAPTFAAIVTMDHDARSAQTGFSGGVTGVEVVAMKWGTEATCRTARSEFRAWGSAATVEIVPVNA